MKREGFRNSDLYSESRQDLGSTQKAAEFVSVTEVVVELSKNHVWRCPRCDYAVSFNYQTEWFGPEHFACSRCQQLMDIKSVLRELQKLER